MEGLGEEWAMGKFEEIVGTYESQGAGAWKEPGTGAEPGPVLGAGLEDDRRGIAEGKGFAAGEGFEAYRKFASGMPDSHPGGSRNSGR
eukprot:4082653-Alexandrium_andersonii.AAC.1